MPIGNLLYMLYITILVIGLWGSISCANIIKKLISMNIAQTGIILLYVAIGYRFSGWQPIHKIGVLTYVDPVPQVLMLTAIVVGISVNAIGLAISVKIKQHFGTLDEDELEKVIMDGSYLNNK